MRKSLKIHHSIQSQIQSINKKCQNYVMSKNFIALYVDTLLAFTARAGFLGRRSSRKMPGSSSPTSCLAAKMAEGPERRQSLAVKACHQANCRRKGTPGSFLRARAKGRRANERALSGSNGGEACQT